MNSFYQLNLHFNEMAIRYNSKKIEKEKGKQFKWRRNKEENSRFLRRNEKKNLTNKLKGSTGKN